MIVSEPGLDLMAQLGSFADTTYPREGTETIELLESAEKPLDTTYPREGTETRP